MAAEGKTQLSFVIFYFLVKAIITEVPLSMLLAASIFPVLCFNNFFTYAQSELEFKIKKPQLFLTGVNKINLGSYLLSHTPTHIVPSAFRGLTSLFGMGRGVTPGL
jgi:hypothetical protein